MLRVVVGEIRRRCRGAVLVGLVLGIGTAATLTALAGARRTQTAYPRMIEATEAADFLVSSFDPDADGRRAFYDEVVELEGIEAAGRIVALNLVPTAVKQGAGTSIEACSNLPVDGGYGTTVDRPNVRQGRLPRADAVHEVLVTQTYASTFDVDVGDHLDLVHYVGDATPVAGRATAADGPVIPVEVVGIGVPASQVVPVSDLDASPRLFGTPALVERYGTDPDTQCYDGIVLATARGVDPQSMAAALERLGRRHGGALVQPRHDADDDVRRAVQPQVSALYLFALAAGLGTVVVASQLTARNQQHAAAATPTWRALGMTRAQVRTLVAAPSAASGLLGVATGALVAVALSPRFPIGPARVAEPDPGVAIHLPVHVGGAVVAGLGTIAIGALTSALVLRPGRSAGAPTLLSRLGTATSSAWLMMGLQLTSGSRRGAGAVPIRSAAAGAALAVAAVAGTVTFSAGLDDLVDEPARYGQDWDVMLDGVFGPAPIATVLERLSDERAVESIAAARHGDVRIDGREVGTIGIADLRGSTFPVIIDGRKPLVGDEIVIGRRSLHELGRRIGDDVEVDAGDGVRTMTVVGTAAFPRLNRGSFNTLGLGEGAVVPMEALPPYDISVLGAPPGTDFGAFEAPDGTLAEMVMLRFDPAASSGQRHEVMATLRDIAQPLELAIRTEQRPTAIDSYGAVRSTPLVLVVVLSVMAVGAIVHLVLSVVWRRRRDLAICSALGMRRRQVRQAVGFAALMIAAAALAGAPVGVAAGRIAWRAFAHELGVSDAMRMPVGLILAVVLLTCALAVSAGVISARITSRRRPADELRAA